jgi:RNA-directed DNA polymerase
MATEAPSELQGLALIQSLSTKTDVADRLNVSLRTLTWVLYGTGTEGYYKSWLIAKKSGGVREIRAPRSTLYRMQASLNQILQDAYSPKPAAHGFVRGRSVVTNAGPHVGRRYVLNVDVEDFFPSINFGRVRGLFMARPFQCPPDVATLLAAICCSGGSLPIGSPTSPVVANMICVRLDSELQTLARRNGSWYSRYADDLTFSTNRSSFPRALARLDDDGRAVAGDELRHVVEANGFALNQAKTRLQTQHDRQSVTGLVVNERRNIDRRYIRRIRAMLHAWDRYGLESAQTYVSRWDRKDRHPEASPRFEDMLAGRIAYLAMVRGPSDPIAERFKAQYSNLMANRPMNEASQSAPSKQPPLDDTDPVADQPPLDDTGPVADQPPLDDTGVVADQPPLDDTEVVGLSLLAGLPADVASRWEGRDDPVGRSVLHALDLYARGTREDIRSAVRELAVILEERRQLIKQELISSDEGALFNIANNFDVRHRNTDQKSDYRLEFLDWIFWWYLHTVDLTERIVGGVDGGPE